MAERTALMDPALVRLQILTPLSVLINLGANLVAALAIEPGTGRINDEYLVILTPKKSMIGFYWLVLYVLQICYCMLLVMARKPETRDMLVNGVGIRLPIANLLMAVWAIFWNTKVFVGAEIVLLINVLIMFSIWATLLRHPATRGHPLDYAFVHVPMRLFTLVLWNVDIWQNGLLAFNWFKYIGDDVNQGHGKWEPDHVNHAWIVFGILLAVGIINAAIVFLTRDAIWAIATIYLLLAVVLKGDKPAQVFIPLVLLSVLQGVALTASYLWHKYGSARTGRIALPEDDGEGHVATGFASSA